MEFCISLVLAKFQTNLSQVLDGEENMIMADTLNCHVMMYVHAY